MKRFSKDWWNPRVQGGVRWVHVHITATLLIAAIVASIIIGTGVFAYHQLSGSHFVYKCTQYQGQVCVKHTGYKAPLVAPSKHVKVHVNPQAVSSVPTSYMINMNYLPRVGNQDGLGACQAFAIYQYQLPYIYNSHYNRSWANTTGPRPIRFSSRFAYDTVTGGVDYGSNYGQEVAVAENQGIPLWRQFPYGSAITSLYPNFPMFADDNPQYIPSLVSQQAKKYSISTHMAIDYPGAGPGGTTLIKAYMEQYHAPANIDIPIYPEFDNASIYPRVGLPTPTESSRGGHAITIIGWNDSLQVRNGDGTYSTGAFIIVNQWQSDWGGTISLGQNNGSNGGYAALSYAFVEKYGWGAVIMSVNWPTTPASQAGIGGYRNRSPLPIMPPPAGASKRVPSTLAGSWYVHSVTTRDLGSNNIDLSSYLNSAGSANGVSPIGLAATLGGECGLNTGNGNFSATNDDCSRYGLWPDVSFGACQVTVQTAGMFGWGNGLYTTGNTNYVHFNLENHPTTCVSMEGRVMGDYASITHLPYPYLMVAWNCGPGWSTYALEHPYTISQQCGQNFDNYVGWYNYALAHWATSSPPVHRFPITLWNSYRIAHHEHPISPYYGKNLSLIAQAWWKYGGRYIGGVVGQYHYYGSGFSEERFQYKNIVVWPSHPSWVPKYLPAHKLT